jgi:hypothetical protein
MYTIWHNYLYILLFQMSSTKIIHTACIFDKLLIKWCDFPHAITITLICKFLPRYCNDLFSLPHIAQD